MINLPWEIDGGKKACVGLPYEVKPPCWRRVEVCGLILYRVCDSRTEKNYCKGRFDSELVEVEVGWVVTF